jgi:hypothetical protein
MHTQYQTASGSLICEPNHNQYISGDDTDLMRAQSLPVSLRAMKTHMCYSEKKIAFAIKGDILAKY